MSTQNSINKKSGELTIDPGTSGDSFVQFNINGTGEFRIGVDDSDSDSFKISQGSALGATDTFVMTSAGQRTMPLQSAFGGEGSATDSNVTGDGSVYSIAFPTEIFDQNNNWATPTFTASITGRFCFNIQFLMKGIDSGHTAGNFALVTSNRTYTFNLGNPSIRETGGGNTTGTMSFFADMDDSDTASWTATISNGTKVVDFINGSFTYASAFLLC